MLYFYIFLSLIQIVVKILQILLFIATNMTDISWGDILEIDIKI